MHKSIAAILLLAVAACAADSQATPVTVPPGLHQGDHYRLAFVTSTTTDATSNSITNYNSFATTSANSNSQLAALGTTWAAIASTTNIDADVNTSTIPNTSPDYPIYNLEGDLVATSNFALWDTDDNDLLGNFAVNQNGQELFAGTWTGTNDDGTSAGSFSLGGATPYTGFSSETNYEWIGFGVSGVNANTVKFSLYGISGVLTVPVPEPSTLVLAALGGLALLAMRPRRA